MVLVQLFYRPDTLQIDAVFQECLTTSTKWKDSATYIEVNVTDPPFSVSRNHKVVLDDEGKVVDTEPSANPVQPAPTPNPNKDLIDDLRDRWPAMTPDQKQEVIRRALRRILGE